MPNSEQQLLSDMLDALDDLYDGMEQADVRLLRLLKKASLALAGTSWEQILSSAAASVESTIGVREEGIKYRRALVLTDDLRRRIANAP